MRNFGYLLREGFRSVWKNRLMAAASIIVLTACILITGLAALVFINVNYVFEQVAHQNVVVVWLQRDVTDADIEAVGDELNAMSNVSGVEFLSKEEILDRYAKEMGSEELYEALKEDNPMQDSYIVTFYDLSLFEQTLDDIRDLPQTESIEAQTKLADQLSQLRNILMIAGAVVVVLLVLVSLFIISNTIKLTVYSRRLEIGIMKAVGATNFFIRTPFVVEGAVIGLLSALVAYLVTWLAYDRVMMLFGGEVIGMGLLSFQSMWWIVLLAYLAGGVLTGMVGSAISMGRYLKDEGGDPTL
ncbi:MAG: permease-like cell division protein FtsX [Clostridia bacterium]|nr:permease-like cell division protein FtsX [Clostridia bacterium]MBQ2939211.1 permease-like cell division protein FtsX [Clostridia bacterium]